MENGRRIVVMISGKKESGKDTAANFLCDNYGFVRFGFADKLKDKVSADFGLDRKELDDQKKKAEPILTMPVITTEKDAFAAMVQNVIASNFRTPSCVEPNLEDNPSLLTRSEDGRLLWNGAQLYYTRRALLILEGCAKRTADPNYWVDSICDLAIKGVDRIVVSDWRLPNESARIQYTMQKLGYTVIFLRIDFETKSKDVDITETALDHYPGFHARIFNKKDGFEPFYNMIKAALAKYLVVKDE